MQDLDIQAKHTPEPWTLRQAVDNPHVRYWLDAADQSIPIADIKANGETEANARLIAAAPDLLAALQEVATANPELFAGHEAERIVKDWARVAIAKARG